MGGLSLWHLLLLLGIALLFFGPSRLPDLGKSLGEAIRGFKKGISGDEIDVTDGARREEIKGGDQAGKPQSQSQKEKDKA